MTDVQKNSKNQDDFLEDEFDLQDADDLDDDLADEAWDDLDDDGDAMDGTGDDSIQGQKKKSFFMKNFNMIVIVLALVFGAVLFYSQFSAPPSPTSGSAMPAPDAMADDTAETDAMPAPSPMDTPDMGQDTGQGDLPMPTPMDSSEDAELTPMPMPETSMPMPMAQDIPPVPAEEADPVASMPDMSAPAPEAPMPAEEPEQTMAIEITSTQEPVTTAAADPALRADMTALQERVESLSSDLQTQMKKTADQMTAMAETLSSLESSLAKRLDAIEKTARDAKKLAESRPAAPARAAQPPAEDRPAPAPKAAPAAEKQPAPAMPPRDNTAQEPGFSYSSGAASRQTVEWELRSAQPGRAVIYGSKTGDTRTVEVGDSLSGIGKILSISVQNGRWVVQGTQGQISR